jgi:hypothetical protein
MRIFHLNCPTIDRKVTPILEVEDHPQFHQNGLPDFVHWCCDRCGVLIKGARPTYPPGDGVFYSFPNPTVPEHFEEIAVKL